MTALARVDLPDPLGPMSAFSVSNPVEPRENFADRWRRTPELQGAFRKLLDHVQRRTAIAVSC